jgi:50S ribosomal protein L16 3-hydroxylase
MKRFPRNMGLAALVYPLEPKAFLDEYWPHRPFVTHAPLARLQEIVRSPEIASLHTMVQTKHRSVRIWVKNLQSGAHQAVVATPSQAEKLYSSEAVTISIDDIEVPAVSRLLRQLVKDMRGPIQQVVCNAYVSPGGKGTTAMHFDNHEVFALQIRGRKRWQFAPNTHVPSPPEDYAVGTEVTPALRRLCAREMPDRLPAGAKSVVLSPGSVLFLPKGYWHLTHTLEASVHLTFAVTSLAWLDLVIKEVRERLMREEGWRRTPGVLFGAGPREEQAQHELSSLVGALTRELSALHVRGLAPGAYPSRAMARPS